MKLRILILVLGLGWPLVPGVASTDILKPEAPPILADGLFQHNAAGRKTYQMQIQLPNVECASCTLQVIQVMTDKAPYTVGGDDVYHECADIVLSAAAPSDGGAPAPDAASPGTGGSGGSGGTGGAGTGGGSGAGGTGGTGTGGTGGASGTGGGAGGTAT